MLGQDSKFGPLASPPLLAVTFKAAFASNIGRLTFEQNHSIAPNKLD
jgi:hypothetical protein